MTKKILTYWVSISTIRSLLPEKWSINPIRAPAIVANRLSEIILNRFKSRYKKMTKPRVITDKATAVIIVCSYIFEQYLTLEVSCSSDV